MSRGFADRETPTLTPRELEVLRLAAHGLTLRAIWGELGISRYTVISHIRHIHEKLDVPSTTAAVWAARDQLEDEGASA